MEWTCSECNMKFQSSALYENHKKKFCVLRGGVESLPLNNRGTNVGRESVLASPDKNFGKHFMAPSPVKTSEQLPNLRVSTNKKDDFKPSAIEMEKIMELKKLKERHSKNQTERHFGEKLLNAGVKENPSTYSVQMMTGQDLKQGSVFQMYEEKLDQLSKSHQQQLQELQSRNKRLEQEKAVINERMKQINAKSSYDLLIPRYSDNIGRKLHRLKTDQMDSNGPRDRNSATIGNQETESQLVLYDPKKASQCSPSFSTSFPGGDILDELKMLKHMYTKRGGNNPLVLNQIRELEYEAHLLKSSNRPGVIGMEPVVQQQIMAQQLHNQRLEQELKLLRERREKSTKERSPSPELPEYLRLKEEHKTKLTQLKQESEILKQQSEIAKMKKELKELEYEDPSGDYKKSSEKPLARTGMERTLSPSPYDPKGGFVIFWDFIVGLSPSFTNCRLAVGVYDGNSLVTDVKVFPQARVTQESQETGHLTFSPGAFVLLCLKQPFPRCAPKLSLSLVVELQATSSVDPQDPDKLYSIGWTKMELFDSRMRVVSGRWKMPLRESPMQAHLNMNELNRVSQVGLTEMCFRIVNKRDEGTEELFNPKPLHYRLYSFPPTKNYHVSENIRIQSTLTPLSPSVPSLPPQPESRGSQPLQSAPRTASPERLVGFQVDQIVDAMEGEATVEITAYNRVDGKVLNSTNNIPVSFKTTPVKQDFLNGIHAFGLQQRHYEAVAWDQNSIVVLRLYIEPTGRQTQENERRTGNEVKLTAWTVFPLAVTLDRTTSSPHNTSHRTNSQLAGSTASLVALTRLNTGTHKLPLFFPPLPELGNATIKLGEFPNEWQRYGNATAILSVFSGLYQAPDLSVPPAEYHGEDELPQSVWIKHNRSTAVTDTFVAGQGFDLYIDGARFLPDSVTFSKVAGRVMDKAYGRIGAEIDVQATLESDIYHPEYNSRFEYRELVVHPTATLMLKIYTVDRISQQLCCLGYVFFALFLGLENSQQPSSDSETKVALNEGAHQVRIYNGNPDFSRPLSEALINTLKPIPCASLLIRLYKAACHSNGRPKEISQFQEDEWEQEGLVVPKPRYEEGVYFSRACEPSLGETQMFHSMVKRAPIKVRQSVSLLVSGQEQKLRNDLIFSWIKSQLTRSIDTQPVDFDMLYVSQYHPLHGLKISLDAAQNLPWLGVTMATICLSPPGAFYMGELKDPLSFITELNFHSDVRSPVWTDGFKVYPRRSYNKNLVVFFHLYEIGLGEDRELKSEQQAWTAVQVFHRGYVRAGSYRLPLYHHKPNQVVVNAMQNDACQDVLAGFRRRKLVKLMEGSSISVRISDARRAEELCGPTENVSLEYLPKEKLDKNTISGPSKILSSLIPDNMEEEEFRLALIDRLKQLTRNNFQENIRTVTTQ